MATTQHGQSVPSNGQALVHGELDGAEPGRWGVKQLAPD
jgi:hypothetical protein